MILRIHNERKIIKILETIHNYENSPIHKSIPRSLLIGDNEIYIYKYDINHSPLELPEN